MLVTVLLMSPPLQPQFHSKWLQVTDGGQEQTSLALPGKNIKPHRSQVAQGCGSQHSRIHTHPARGLLTCDLSATPRPTELDSKGGPGN